MTSLVVKRINLITKRCDDHYAKINLAFASPSSITYKRSYHQIFVKDQCIRFTEILKMSDTHLTSIVYHCYKMLKDTESTEKYLDRKNVKDLARAAILNCLDFSTSNAPAFSSTSSAWQKLSLKASFVCVTLERKAHQVVYNPISRNYAFQRNKVRPPDKKFAWGSEILKIRAQIVYY